jgi:Asp-tRNA(Asn)/Glu-tRNA(Gln) amidotransferase C subunit
LCCFCPCRWYNAFKEKAVHFDRKKIKANARMVRIHMPDDLADKMIADMESVVEWIAMLDPVDVSGVEPLITTADWAQRRRPD